MLLIRTIFITFGHSCGSIARSLRSLSAPGPLQKTPAARVPCTFRHQGPIYISDCMHHTLNFLNFVCYLLTSSCLQYSTHMLFVIFLFFCKFASRRYHCLCHLFNRIVACSLVADCASPTFLFILHLCAQLKIEGRRCALPRGLSIICTP